MTLTARKLTLSCCVICFLLLSDAACADSWSGLYAGIMDGYGSTNWGKISSSDDTLQTSLPSDAQDSGNVWGFFIGDNIAKNYGVELRYQKFATSKISFAQFNEYSPGADGFPAFSMNSETDSYSLLGILRIPVNNIIELYSVIGGAYTQRRDQLANVSGIGGVFGGGARIIFNKQFSSSLEFDFVTGNAPVNLMPAENYLPFLTSLNYKLIYSF